MTLLAIEALVRTVFDLVTSYSAIEQVTRDSDCFLKNHSVLNALKTRDITVKCKTLKKGSRDDAINTEEHIGIVSLVNVVVAISTKQRVASTDEVVLAVTATSRIVHLAAEDQAVVFVIELVVRRGAEHSR